MASDVKNVLVLVPADDAHLEQLKDAAPGAAIRLMAHQPPTAEDLAGADVVVGNLSTDQMAHLKAPKLLQLNSSGVPESYLKLKQRLVDTVLCSASGAYGLAISEHMLAMLLSLMKRLHTYRDDQRHARWVDRGQVRSLAEARVLVVGMGDIGLHFAMLCTAMGATVRGVKRRMSAPPKGVEAVYTQQSLDGLLPWADVVALSLPDTPDTRQLMDARRFGLMKKGSYLLNVGRGSAIDQDALLNAVRKGVVAGAGLDVTTPEPLPADNPLWQEEDILITPHISGGYHLKKTLDNIIDIACHNIQALPGGPFIAEVDLETGYRA
ncbi:MAG: D-2-hydroxyacid dehydrogenase [Clostridiales bacterium]|nr:D-2-hydroxyacid dehydrogenase [Clostridiales bacterium]